MPVTPAKRPQSPDRYWERRLTSKAFKHALTDTLARELRLLANERVADVLDAEMIRTAIGEWDTRLIDRARVAELIIQTNRRVTARLSRRPESLLDVLDRQLVAEFEALLVDASAQTQEFVGDIMQQEFVRRLFTDIIFTAIVSFNQKVNPLFGGLTMRVLEDQIKGFIRMLMPMLIEQATAFAVSESNQRIALDFARQIMRQLLDQPLRNFAASASPAQRKKVEAVIHKAVTNTRLEAVIRQTTLATWDDLYAVLQHQRAGDILRLDKEARWLAEQCVAAILPLLRRPQVVQLIAGEVALAARGGSNPASTARRDPTENGQ